MTAGIDIVGCPSPTVRSAEPSHTRPPTSGTTRVRSTSSSTRSASERSGRRRTRPSLSTYGTRIRASGGHGLRELALERPDATRVGPRLGRCRGHVDPGRRLLEPVFEAQPGGRAGSRSRPNPMLFRSPPQMVDQAVRFSGARAQYHREVAGDGGRDRSDRGGDVPRAQRQRHGQLHRRPGDCRSRCHRTRPAPARRRGSADTQRMGPVVTLMMGRVEDWLRVVVDRDGLTIDPDALPWSGVAVFKRAYGEFRSEASGRACWARRSATTTTGRS